jgi:transposase
VIHQDDTGMRVLDREHPKGIKRGHIWALCGGPWIVYRYAPNWRGEHPREFLDGYAGVIQGDGYAGINALFTGENAKETRAGCMMHCRRYFFDAHKTGDSRAGIALALIHKLYEIEALAKSDALMADARQLLRKDRSLPIMHRLKRWIEGISGSAPPKSPLGKAVTYATKQWESLMVPFFDGRLEIDNGEAERRLKVLAIGRKNWLFAGSDAGTERIATILTVLGTAVAHGIDPLAYLTDILRRIADGIPSSSVAELMPDGWAKQHGQNAHTGQAGIPRLVV